MTTLLITHDQSGLNHLTPLGHPERADRMRVIDRILEHERFQPLEREGEPRFQSSVRVPENMGQMP